MSMAMQLATTPQAGADDAEGKGVIACFRCGVCCEGRRVRLSLSEARHICDGLGLNWYIFLGSYLEPISSEGESFFLRQRDGTCVFLKNTDDPRLKVCIVHHFKPSSCQLCSASLLRRDCQKGLARYWGISVDAEGKLSGDSQNIASFRHFFSTHLARHYEGYQIAAGQSPQPQSR